jgi:hypothetical protein
MAGWCVLRIGETDCVAGVIGLELLNPSGQKSAGVAARISVDLAETARQRLFTFELRCGGHAAAARSSAGRTLTAGAVQYAWLVGFEL